MSHKSDSDISISSEDESPQQQELQHKISSYDDTITFHKIEFELPPLYDVILEPIGGYKVYAQSLEKIFVHVYNNKIPTSFYLCRYCYDKTYKQQFLLIRKYSDLIDEIIHVILLYLNERTIILKQKNKMIKISAHLFTKHFDEF